MAELEDGPLRDLTPLERDIFLTRLRICWADAVRPLHLLYGDRPDFALWLAKLVRLAAEGYAGRPAELRLLDIQRQSEPDWFQLAGMLGYVCYAGAPG